MPPIIKTKQATKQDISNGTNGLYLKQTGAVFGIFPKYELVVKLVKLFIFDSPCGLSIYSNDQVVHGQSSFPDYQVLTHTASGYYVFDAKGTYQGHTYSGEIARTIGGDTRSITIVTNQVD
ncbi:hypothetical protein [Fructobacillus fructosus]|uniref:hypothetical protein n=1 Tax=Fructobacillus fructosus TaxID=1631 RepID=UPI0030C85B8E